MTGVSDVVRPPIQLDEADIAKAREAADQLRRGYRPGEMSVPCLRCLGHLERQQAAEIERLTRERQPEREQGEPHGEAAKGLWQRRFEASEDRALTAEANYAAAVAACNSRAASDIASEARAADLLKAAEGVIESFALGPLDMAAKYGPDVSPEQIQDYALDTLSAAIAAAKGETV